MSQHQSKKRGTLGGAFGGWCRCGETLGPSIQVQSLQSADSLVKFLHKAVLKYWLVVHDMKRKHKPVYKVYRLCLWSQDDRI